MWTSSAPLSTTSRRSYLDRIAAKEFDAVLLSPPCASFSRAPWANFRGPRPVRSYDSPRGLQKLTPAERDRAILGNIFADFSYEVATLVADGAATFFAMEQPEDLGALASGPHEGLRPASMWQWPQLADLLSKGLCTVAFHQASFGTPYAKPTRLLCCGHRYPCRTVSMKARPAMTQKAATLDHCRLLRVMGLCSRGRLQALSELQVRNSGPLSSVSGSPLCWSPPACMLLTLPLVRGIASSVETLPPSSETFPLNHPEGPRVLGGTGPPRFCRQLGGGKPFHDGGGLCSPGRWPHHARSYADGPQWEWLRKRTLELIPLVARRAAPSLATRICITSYVSSGKAG